MVTREIEDDLICIRQRDHAAVSGWLAEAWGSAEVPALAPREAVVIAARHHDDGWIDVDSGPRFNPATGQPYSYKDARAEVALAVADRSVEAVAERDPYAGWLVSRHFASFHAGVEHDPDRAKWVERQVGRRARLLAEAADDVPPAALHPHALEANFDWLQLLDSVSLALCHAWQTWESRPMAAEYGEAETRYRYCRREFSSDGLAVVGTLDPFPFEARALKTRVVTRRLTGCRWSGATDLLRAWESGAPASLEVTLSAA